MPRAIEVSAERLVRRIPAPSGLVQPVIGVDPQPYRAVTPRSRLLRLDGRFVGGAASDLIVPSWAMPGDYAVVAYYGAFNIVGGADVAWDLTTPMSGMGLRHRALLPGDFLSPLTFSGGALPYCAAFLRVSRPVSALQLRSSLTYSGDAGVQRALPGFIKSADSMALIGVSTTVSASVTTLNATEWPHDTEAGLGGGFVSMHVQDRPSYTRDTSGMRMSGNGASNKNGAIFELIGAA